jgi:hypothetical protein
MKHHTRLSLYVLLLCGFCALSTGCVAVAVGAAVGVGYGAAHYVNGDTEGLIAADPPLIGVAVQSVFVDNDIALRPGRDQEDSGKIVLKGTLMNNKPVTVTIKPQDLQVSKVSVRIGIFGDQAISDMLFARINERVSP